MNEQLRDKDQFKVDRSEVQHPEAGMGLFFKGNVPKKTKMCGYGGKLHGKDHRGQYVALLPNTNGTVIDAVNLAVMARNGYVILKDSKTVLHEY